MMPRLTEPAASSPVMPENILTGSGCCVAPANLGMNANLAATLEACQGEYVAVLEGDDYWTDNEKLARHAGFLDAHPECASCFHNVVVFADDAKVRVERLSRRSGRSPIDVRAGFESPTFAGRLFQAKFYPDLFRDVPPVQRRNVARNGSKSFPSATTPLHILCTEHGLAAYLPEVMGAYRLHSSSVWSGKTQLYRMSRALEMYEALDRAILRDGRNGRLCARNGLDMLQGYARLLKREGRSPEAAAMAGTYLKLAGKSPMFCLKHFSSVRRMFVLICKVKLGRPTKS